MFFQLTAPAFSHGDALPSRHTAEGGNRSPALAWTDPPEGARSLTLVMLDVDAPDPHAPEAPRVHWLVVDLPSDLRRLEEGARSLPAGAVVGVNDFGVAGYEGPHASERRHRYAFKLYALSGRCEPEAGPRFADLGLDSEPRLVGCAQLYGVLGGEG